MTKLKSDWQETHQGGRGRDKREHTHWGVAAYMVLHRHHSYPQPIR